MKTKPLSEQVAIVTGGGTGIGRSFTEALASAGVKVVIASRREEVLRKAANEINGKLEAERVFSYPLDIRDPLQITSLTGRVLAQRTATRMFLLTARRNLGYWDTLKRCAIMCVRRMPTFASSISVPDSLTWKTLSLGKRRARALFMWQTWPERFFMRCRSIEMLCWRM